MADYIKKIRTASGDKQIDYRALANLPAALKNPNALTFTGAVVGTYDGAQALSLEIPSGAALDSDNVTGVLPISKGGTGATTAPAARTALGLGNLATEDSIPLGGSYATGTLPLSKGGTGATTAAAARTKLGLGALATKNAVGLNGSDVTGTLPVGKGGTGATTIAGILSALGISDYIVSSGTTAKTGITWAWRKYASGVAMCWGTCDQITADITTAWGNSVYVPGPDGNAGPFDLPFDFTTSRCWAAPATWVGDYWLCTWWSPDPTKQTPGYQPVRGNSKTGMTYSIALFVIGAWK